MENKYVIDEVLNELRDRLFPETIQALGKHLAGFEDSEDTEIFIDAISDFFVGVRVRTEIIFYVEQEALLYSFFIKIYAPEVVHPDSKYDKAWPIYVTPKTYLGDIKTLAKFRWQDATSLLLRMIMEFNGIIESSVLEERVLNYEQLADLEDQVRVAKEHELFNQGER